METKNQSLFNLTNDELSKFFYHEQDKNGFGKMIKLKLNFKNNKSRVFRFTGRLDENEMQSIVSREFYDHLEQFQAPVDFCLTQTIFSSLISLA